MKSDYGSFHFSVVQIADAQEQTIPDVKATAIADALALARTLYSMRLETFSACDRAFLELLKVSV